MKSYLLGIDIGTSGCKAAVFDRNGTVLASVSESYPVYYPQPGWAEQNPVDWWDAVCKAIRKIMQPEPTSFSSTEGCAAIHPCDIAGIGIDGQSWSAIAVDRNGTVLTNTPIWMDTRAQQLCDELNAKISSLLDPEAIFRLSGNSLQPSYTTAKILWYQKHLPEVYKKIDKILQSNSYIAYKLTGVMSQDVSQGYGLHCFDMHTASWDADMCENLGIPLSFLPDIYQCHQVIGTVTREAAAQCGLCPGIPVVAGGLDAACGTLGTGVLRNGETQEQGGQAGGMSICTDTYKADPRLILSFHVVPDRWLLQGGTTGGGGVMRWLEQELGDYEREESRHSGKSSLELLGEQAAQVPAGSDGLVFLPYMSGERSPIWDPDAKGVYYGLDFRKTKGHLIRAAMEGVAFSLKHNLEAAKEAGAQVSVLRAMGGSANSLLWTQIKSDVTGLPIVVPASDTATTLGAALLAGVGVGMYQDFEEAVEATVHNRREHQPDPAKSCVYDHNYAIYLALYQNLKQLMHI